MTKEELYSMDTIQRCKLPEKMDAAARQFGMALKAATQGIQDRALHIAAKSELEAFAA